MRTAIGRLQAARDVVAIGVPRVGFAGTTLPEPAALVELPFFNSVLSTQHDSNPFAGVATWVGGDAIARGDSGGAASSNAVQALWVFSPQGPPRRVVEIAGDEFLESPRVSKDGRWVAYALHGSSGLGTPQIRVAAVDGTEDRQIAEHVEANVEPPFRLAPLGWTGDGSRVLLASNSEIWATPRGMHEVVVATGEVRPANTPDETLWFATLDPAGTRLAYSTFEWTTSNPSTGGDAGPAEPAPPYRLKVLDLTTGDTDILLEGDSNRYGHIAWSPEGARLMVGVLDAPDPSGRVMAVHLATGEEFPLLHAASWDSSLKHNADLVPMAWLPGEIAVFAAGDDALVVTDLDATNGTDAGSAWWSLEPPSGESEVEFLGYLSPAEDVKAPPLLPEYPSA